MFIGRQEIQNVSVYFILGHLKTLKARQDGKEYVLIHMFWTQCHPQHDGYSVPRKFSIQRQILVDSP